MNEKNVSSEMLSGAQAAESTLARGEYVELEDSLPEGHPLREQVEKAKADLGGDLGGLPDGHPLILQLRAAKERYDADIAEETEDAQEKAKEVKKAKKLDRAKARSERIAKEEERAGRSREAAKAVNREISSALDSVRELYKVLSEYEEDLNVNPLSRARALRLKRMLVAVERGLSDSRMGGV